MSLKLNERYPGRFNNPSADYPQGSFKNRTSPAAKDGSYLEKDWANDKEAFFQSLLEQVGVSPNGLVDRVGASQYYDALVEIISAMAPTPVQATESAAGVAKVATQALTNAGVDDAAIVTPKKLRAGFVSSFTLNGFIAFPTWLGGLVIQWGRTAVIGDGTSMTISLPASFTSTTLQLWTSLYGDVSGDATASRYSSGKFLSLSQIKVSYNETTTALRGSAVTWLCVGF